jgi:hypothetical protein
MTPVSKPANWSIERPTQLAVLHDASTQFALVKGSLNDSEAPDNFIHRRASLGVDMRHVGDKGSDELESFLVLYSTSDCLRMRKLGTVRTSTKEFLMTLPR